MMFENGAASGRKEMLRRNTHKYTISVHLVRHARGQGEIWRPPVSWATIIRKLENVATRSRMTRKGKN
eukprot:scaffold185347_cov45-Prasinocladus_malaysianus.AAC.4